MLINATALIFDKDGKQLSKATVTGCSSFQEAEKRLHNLILTWIDSDSWREFKITYSKIQKFGHQNHHRSHQ